MEDPVTEDRRTNASLREENAQLLRINHKLRYNLPSYPAGGNTTCLLRKMLPLEIRIKIYELLLINPELDQARWIGENTGYGATFKYGLTPAIMRTCRWILQESSPVLYNSNTFVLACASHNNNVLSRSPLTRYMKPQHHQNHTFLLDGIVFFGSIRRWRVIITTLDNSTSRNQFAYFCQKLSHSPPRHLEVKVILPGLHYDLSVQMLHAYPQKQMDSVLKSLGILRNVREIDISAAGPNDLSGCLIKRFKPTFVAGYATDEIAKCARIVSSNTPVERVFGMNAKLLSYAQAFERNPNFKIDMNPTPRLQKARNMDISAWKNPFLKEDSIHPIEMALRAANQASDLQSPEDFRSHRTEILDYLEPHYQRATRVIETLRDFVDAKKGGYDCFEDAFDEDFPSSEWCEEALLLVEAQSKLLERDVTPEISLLMRKKPIFRLGNEDLRREKAIRGMKALHESSGGFEFNTIDDDVELVMEFKECFKRVVDDMMDQYLEIRKARREIFDFDAPGTIQSIDVTKDVVDLPIAWVEDPEIFLGDY